MVSAEPKKNPFLIGGLTGLSSTLVSTVPLQPLDVIKTRLQQERTSVGAVISKVYRENGVAGFWRGIGPTLLRNLPGMALYFSLVHQAELSLVRYGQVYNSSVDNLILGAGCRGAVDMIMMPVTVIKTRFESSIYVHQRKSVFGLLRELNWRTLFSGSSATVLRDAPYAGVYYSLYQTLKSFLAAQTNALENGLTLVNFTAALLAGTLATTITQPFDVIKTNLQLSATTPKVTRQLRSAFSQAYRSGGVRALLIGLGPRLLKKGAHSALTWTMFEELKR